MLHFVGQHCFDQIHITPKTKFFCLFFEVWCVMYQNSLVSESAKPTEQDVQRDAVATEVYPGLSTNTWQRGSGRVAKEISLLLAELPLHGLVCMCGRFWNHGVLKSSTKKFEIITDLQGCFVKQVRAIMSASEFNYSVLLNLEALHELWCRMLKRKVRKYRIKKITERGRQSNSCLCYVSFSWTAQFFCLYLALFNHSDNSTPSPCKESLLACVIIELCIRERQMKNGKKRAKPRKGQGRGCCCERKYECVWRGEHDMHCVLMCARVTGWGCTQLCQNT